MIPTPQGPAPGAAQWKQAVTADGRTYYFNSVTGQSVWEKPDEMKTPGERILGACPWKEHRTQDDRVYFYNAVTRETRWEKPPELLEAEQRAATEDAAYNTALGQQAAAAATIQHEPSIDNKQSNGHDKGSSSMDLSDGELVVYSKDSPEGVEAFKKFLKEKNLASYLQWEQAHASISSDPRYKQFVNVKQKKSHYQNYRSQKAKEERDESKAKVSKLREELEEVMFKYAVSPVNVAALKAATAEAASAMTDGKVFRSTTSFNKAEHIFSDMEEWRRLDDGTRKQALENVTRELARRERETTENARKKGVAAFTELLRSNEQVCQLSCLLQQCNIT